TPLGNPAASNKVDTANTAASLTGTAALTTAETAGASTSDNTPYTGDTVSVTGTAAGTFVSKDVANAIAVNVSGLSLTGAQAGNYTLTAPSLTANITARALTVTAASNSKVYDGTTKASATPT